MEKNYFIFKKKIFWGPGVLQLLFLLPFYLFKGRKKKKEKKKKKKQVTQ
jgi:hypothetical protein